MFFWSISGDEVNKFDAAIGPASLFRFIDTKIMPKIDRLDISAATIKEVISKPYFSLKVLRKIEDFYYDDWKVSGCYLFCDDDSIQSLIISTQDEYGNEYRATVNVGGGKDMAIVEAIHYNQKGNNFLDGEINKAILNRIESEYAPYAPPKKTQAALTKPPVPQILRNEDIVFDFSYPGYYVFRSHIGPAELFKTISRLLDNFEARGIDYKSDTMTDDMRVAPMDIQQSLIHFLKNKWLIESCVVNKYLSLDYILLFNKNNEQYHLLLNKYGKAIYIIDCDIDYGEAVQYGDEIYDKVNAIFGITPKKAKQPEPPKTQSLKSEIEPPLPSLISIEQPIIEISPVDKCLIIIPKETNPYAEWYDLFKHKHLIIIGGTVVNTNDIRTICHGLGFNTNNIELYTDYEKLPNKDFTFLKGQKDKYCGIVLGPVPHSVKNHGPSESLETMFHSDPEYPFMAIAFPNTARKELKITASSLKMSLNEIIRNEIRNNPLFM